MLIPERELQHAGRHSSFFIFLFGPFEEPFGAILHFRRFSASPGWLQE
jgi:hypothetical protein